MQSFELINKEYETLRTENRLLPIKVSGFYKKLVDEEVQTLGHREGPLHRIVYPSHEKITQSQDYEVNDFVDDRTNMPEESHQSFIHKYKNRVLFLPISHCIANCMYCFRQDVLEEKETTSKGEKRDVFQEETDTLVEYLKSNFHVMEVILSGGDPIMLPARKLEEFYERLSSETHVRDFRFHTRGLVFNPKSFTEKHMQVFKKYKVRIVHHITHPYELCDENKVIIKQLNEFEIRQYNQFPILRKINDHVDLLVRFMKELDELHIRNLSIYFPDPVKFSSAFRINFKRLFNLIDSFNHSTPSWINATRFCQDSVHGKVRYEDLVEYNESEGYALFEREGNVIKVPDHPVALDDPGQLETLLWKG